MASRMFSLLAGRQGLHTACDLTRRPLMVSQCTNWAIKSATFCIFHRPETQLCNQIFARASLRTIPVLLEQQRYLQFPHPFGKRQDFRGTDRVPPEYKCVYSTSTNHYVAYFYPLTVYVLTASWIAYTKFIVDSLTLNPSMGPLALVWSEIGITTALCVFTLLGLLGKLLAIRYPLRFYYNESDQTFIAVFATVLPWKTSQMRFKCGEVKHLYEGEDDEEPNESIREIFKVFNGEYVIGNKRLVILPHAFAYPFYYNLMLGYTKQDSDS